MFLFLKLYLAHLIGDFILQFEELYRLKLKHVYGHVLHVVIHCLVTMIVVFPYLKEPFMWFFIPLTSTVHFFQDRLKYKYMEQNKKWYFPIFVVDQIGHFFCIATILLFPVSKQVYGLFASPPANQFYGDNLWTVLAIAFIISTFCGSFLFYSFTVSYFRKPRKDHFITATEMTHGIIERMVVTGIFLFSSNPFVLILSGGIGVMRLVSPKLRSMTEFVMSFAYAALVGLLFRLWI
jgi:hypothetical protein